ncbi:unnamed protein product, partial [Rotaria magnacalcarata]
MSSSTATEVRNIIRKIQ